jgi:hypothetical protein
MDSKRDLLAADESDPHEVLKRFLAEESFEAEAARLEESEDGTEDEAAKEIKSEFYSASTADIEAKLVSCFMSLHFGQNLLIEK